MPFSGTALASYVYGYDPAGLLQTQEIDGGATDTIAYNAAEEVTADAYGTYTWDAAGNRTNDGFSLGSEHGQRAGHGRDVELQLRRGGQRGPEGQHRRRARRGSTPTTTTTGC